MGAGHAHRRRCVAAERFTKPFVRKPSVAAPESAVSSACSRSLPLMSASIRSISWRQGFMARRHSAHKGGLRDVCAHGGRRSRAGDNKGRMIVKTSPTKNMSQQVGLPCCPGSDRLGARLPARIRSQRRQDLLDPGRLNPPSSGLQSCPACSLTILTTPRARIAPQSAQHVPGIKFTTLARCPASEETWTSRSGPHEGSSGAGSSDPSSMGASSPRATASKQVFKGQFQLLDSRGSIFSDDLPKAASATLRSAGGGPEPAGRRTAMSPRSAFSACKAAIIASIWRDHRGGFCVTFDQCTWLPQCT